MDLLPHLPKKAKNVLLDNLLLDAKDPHKTFINSNKKRRLGKNIFDCRVGSFENFPSVLLSFASFYRKCLQTF